MLFNCCHVWLFATPWIIAHQAPLSSTISQSLLKFMSTESVMLSNHLLICCPILLLPSIFPCIRIFFSESALHIRWPRYWSFSFSNSPSNEYSVLVSFRIDLFHLLAVQGTLRSLLQHHSLKTSIQNHINDIGYLCCCSVVKSCPTVCDPMDCSTPDFLVLHYLLEFAQIHVH